jgi:hypothetical protein
MGRHHNHNEAVDRELCRHCDFADKENHNLCSLKVMHENKNACRFPNYNPREELPILNNSTDDENVS